MNCERGMMSPNLMQVQIPVISNEQCKESYRRIGQFIADIQFDDRIVCAGFEAGGKDSCYGDSGGPLMLPVYKSGKFSFYQIGIVSCGAACAEPNIPSMNTNVQYFADWIKKKLAGHLDWICLRICIVQKNKKQHSIFIHF